MYIYYINKYNYNIIVFVIVIVIISIVMIIIIIIIMCITCWLDLCASSESRAARLDLLCSWYSL